MAGVDPVRISVTDSVLKFCDLCTLLNESEVPVPLDWLGLLNRDTDNLRVIAPVGVILPD